MRPGTRAVISQPRFINCNFSNHPRLYVRKSALYDRSCTWASLLPPLKGPTRADRKRGEAPPQRESAPWHRPDTGPVRVGVCVDALSTSTLCASVCVLILASYRSSSAKPNRLPNHHPIDSATTLMRTIFTYLSWRNNSLSMTLRLGIRRPAKRCIRASCRIRSTLAFSWAS